MAVNKYFLLTLFDLTASELTFFLCVSLLTQIKQHEFREQFRTELIFSINTDEPYKLVDRVFPRCVVFFSHFLINDTEPLSTDVFYELNPAI